jgi:5-(carboxyamino)imidazole ribonucleotide mutase
MTFKKNIRKNKFIVSIVMGSKSDWKTLKKTAEILKKLNIKFESKIISAHRTPLRLVEFAQNAKLNNISVIIAGAGGSAHLPGMLAAITNLPIIGVPMETKSLKGIDSLLSIVQMPFGIPVGTVAIGETGAKNAALYAASIIALNDNKIAKNLNAWRKKQTLAVKHRPQK